MRAMWNGQVIAESDDTVVVDGQENADAAWCYPKPHAAASNITDRLAFWRGVTLEE